MTGKTRIESVVLLLVGLMAFAQMAKAEGQVQATQPAEAVTAELPKQTVSEAPAAVAPVEVSTNAPVPVAPAKGETVVPQVKVTAVEATTNAAPAVVAPIVPAPVVEAAPVELSESEQWKSSSWQIGTRYLQVELQDTKRGTPGNGSFFGTITTIKEKQEGAPDKAYIQYRIMDWPFWIGVSYDHVVAHTMDDLSIVPDGSGSDGDEEIQGAIPYIQAAWDNSSRFTPYVQAGYAFYQAKFKPNSWGDNGMRWVSAKSNVNGIELGGGLAIRLYKNISADLFARYMQIDDITGEWFYAYGTRGGDFIMTMSYMAYGGGVCWRF